MENIEKKVTMKDIAKKLNVSVTTISKVINNHPDISSNMRKKILETIENMGYIQNFTARNLREQSTTFIGLVISDNTNPYYAEIIRVVEEELLKRNYQMIMFNNDDDLDKEKEFIKDLISINVAGVIITPAKGDSENLKILKKFGIPFVLINRYINKNEDNYVVVDDFKAGLIATDYLIKNRSKKIIYLNGFEEISPAKERLRGYKECLKKNGLPVIKKYIYKEIMKQIDGYEITKKILLEHKPPFSILCISDYVATGVIKYLTEKGVKIPEEISVMGIDNVEKSFFLIPSLTTIDISQKMLGVKSVNILFNLMNKKHYDNEYRIVLEPKLIVRETA